MILRKALILKSEFIAFSFSKIIPIIKSALSVWD